MRSLPRAKGECWRPPGRASFRLLTPILTPAVTTPDAALAAHRAAAARAVALTTCARGQAGLEPEHAEALEDLELRTRGTAAPWPRSVSTSLTVCALRTRTRNRHRHRHSRTGDRDDGGIIVRAKSVASSGLCLQKSCASCSRCRRVVVPAVTRAAPNTDDAGTTRLW